jgi:hypothetical protein
MREIMRVMKVTRAINVTLMHSMNSYLICNVVCRRIAHIKDVATKF